MNTAFSYLSSAELTDVGRRRKNNEDSLVRIPEVGLYCVADGMGGVQGGEIASKACVDALMKEFTQMPDAAFALTAEASARLVERALNAASQWVKDRAESLGFTGTGSTAVVLAFDRVNPSRGMALHAGDSRAYRVRDNKLTPLTTDHSVAAAAGLPDDSTLPPMFRGVITRAVGLAHHVEIESTPFDVAPNDLFLLCSDGLSKMVNDRHIQKLIRRNQEASLDDIARLLVAEALEAGGEDNVTVIVIRVSDRLPNGPTMEIPPETRALESLVLAPPPAPETPHSEEDHDATGQTAEMVSATASTQAEREGAITPSNDRVEGRTPNSGDPNGGQATPTTPASEGRPESAPPAHRVNTLLLILLLALAAGAAIWGLQKWRAGQQSNSTTLEEGSLPSVTDPLHGTQE